MLCENNQKRNSYRKNEYAPKAKHRALLTTATFFSILTSVSSSFRPAQIFHSNEKILNGCRTSSKCFFSTPQQTFYTMLDVPFIFHLLLLAFAIKTSLLFFLFGSTKQQHQKGRTSKNKMKLSLIHQVWHKTFQTRPFRTPARMRISFSSVHYSNEKFNYEILNWSVLKINAKLF